MASLLNKYIYETFKGLIKTLDNEPIDATLKPLSDGEGNELPIKVSETDVEVGFLTSKNLFIEEYGEVIDQNGNWVGQGGGSTGSSGTSGVNGTSGTSGITGTSGTSGTTGANGTSGTSGSSGINGSSGATGSSGTSGINGTSGTSGQAGSSGTSGLNGTSGADGTSGTSGISEPGTPGTSGTSGTDGTSGSSGTNGTSGIDGTSGTSGLNGAQGAAGTSGTSGTNGTSGIGTNGTSGIDGAAGTSGTSGTSGGGSSNPTYINSIKAPANLLTTTFYKLNVFANTFSGTTFTLGAGIVRYTPVMSLATGEVINDVAIFVQTAVAASTIKLGLYSVTYNASGNFYANTLLTTFGTVDSSTTGRKTITGINYTVPTSDIGFFYIGIVQLGGATAAAVYGPTNSASPTMYGSLDATTQQRGMSINGAIGQTDLPATITSAEWATYQSNTTYAYVGFK